MTGTGGRRPTPTPPGHARGRTARPPGPPPGQPPRWHFLTVGEAWPARVQRLGQPGDVPESPAGPDLPGVPIGRVMCGYRSCSADVANVWPAVPVAPEEADDRQADLEAADMELVGAGLRLAGPDEWPRLGHPPASGGATTRWHRVDFRPGIAPGADGIFALTRRAELAWHLAKRMRIPWKRFEPRERRPRWPVEADRRPVRRVMLPGGAFRFRCPLCGRVSAADVAAACPDDCALHAAAADHLPTLHRALWWWGIGPPAPDDAR